MKNSNFKYGTRLWKRAHVLGYQVQKNQLKYVKNLPASNSNSAPSALVSLCRPPPLSSPSPSSCSWSTADWGFSGCAGRCKLTPLKAGVTTMNFIHCRASATKPFFKVTRAGSPSLCNSDMVRRDLTYYGNGCYPHALHTFIHLNLIIPLRNEETRIYMLSDSSQVT